MATGQAGFFERANQGHVLLLLVLLVLVVVAVFLTLVFQYVIPLSAIARFMRTCSAAVAFCKCCERGYKKNHKPPFSECYAVPFNASESIDSAKLTDLEVRIGYEKRYFGEAGKQKLSKVKLRRDPVTSRKVFERTWEVILDTTGQYSYNIRANPEYGAHLKQ